MPKLKHGHFKGGNSGRTPTYNSWRMMKTRCNNNRHSSYPNYGAIGIKVCTRWNEFSNFLEDMGARPYGKTLDRINPYGNYEPANCRWATAKQQAGNKRAA